MNPGAVLKSFIYIVSSSLLYPVLVILALLVLWTIVCYGGFFAEWISRRRIQGCTPEKLPELIHKGQHRAYLSYRVGDYVESLAGVLAGGVNFSHIRIENLLQERTAAILKSLDLIRVVVRVGPGLGLIGTLIPMGTGLAALGQGDMTRLTSELVIAFTTTVVGLAAGLAAFVCLTVKTRWAQEDIKNMELATEVLTSGKERAKAA